MVKSIIEFRSGHWEQVITITTTHTIRGPSMAVQATMEKICTNITQVAGGQVCMNLLRDKRAVINTTASMGMGGKLFSSAAISIDEPEQIIIGAEPCAFCRGTGLIHLPKDLAVACGCGIKPENKGPEGKVVDP